MRIRQQMRQTDRISRNAQVSKLEHLKCSRGVPKVPSFDSLVLSVHLRHCHYFSLSSIYLLNVFCQDSKSKPLVFPFELEQFFVLKLNSWVIPSKIGSETPSVEDTFQSFAARDSWTVQDFRSIWQKSESCSWERRTSRFNFEISCCFLMSKQERHHVISFKNVFLCTFGHFGHQRDRKIPLCGGFLLFCLSYNSVTDVLDGLTSCTFL